MCSTYHLNYPKEKEKIIHQRCTIVIHKSPVLISLIAKKIYRESKIS